MVSIMHEIASLRIGLYVVLLTVFLVTPQGSIRADDSIAESELVDIVDDSWLRVGNNVQWKGDLNGMIDRGLIRILTVPNKTHYFVDGARERGMTVEAAVALEKFVNAQIEDRGPVDVIVIPARRDQLLHMLVEGHGDIATGNLTVTPERSELVDFTDPYAKNVRELVVTAPGELAVKNLRDLSGREVWVRRSSSYYQSLSSINESFIAEGLPAVRIREADELLEDDALLEMVNAGSYPATVVDSEKLDWIWSKVFTDMQVNDVAVRENGELAGAVRKNSPQLVALLNSFIQKHGVGTSHGNEVTKRYLLNSRWAQNINATEDRSRYDAVAEIYKRVSEQYDFDDLMMVALGYQESRLDQNAVSSVGAIGIMQLMPETAAGHPINMKDVSTPEANIEAGIKYMRYLMDNYFNDPEIDEVNRYLFAFAAYNAGPNRVARLRKLASEYQVDPNIWFNNVERIIARKVGQEPVKYVSSVYKYYLAYKRIREIELARQMAR
jgi:membrane-bound lytic murein transglycosylase MltF